MNLYNFTDKIVFNILRDIDSGYLEIISFDGNTMKFGNPEASLKANMRIKKPMLPPLIKLKVKFGFFIIILAFKEFSGFPSFIISP